MSTGVIAVLFLFYVVLWVVLQFKLFDFIFTSFSALLGRLIMGGVIFSFIMTGITVYFWWLTIIITVIAGLAVIFGKKNPVMGIIIIILGIVIGIAGKNVKDISNRKTEKKEQEEIESRKEYQKSLEDSENVEYSDVSYDDLSGEDYTGKNVHTVVTVRVNSNGIIECYYNSENDNSDTILVKEKNTSYCDAGDTIDVKGYYEGYNEYILNDGSDTEIPLIIDAEITIVQKANSSDSQETGQSSDDESNNDGSDESTDEYILPDSDSKIVSKDVIASLSDEDLRLAINEMYARHGYHFKSEDLQEYFDDLDWYEDGGITDQKDIVSEFNDYEKKNMKNLTAERDSR